MTLEFPSYIRTAVSPSAPINFEWDDETNIFLEDARLAKRIGVTTSRGMAALCIGCTEWIVYRFSTLSDDPMPFRYIEAAWVGLSDWSYINIKHGAKIKDWTGPIRNPLFIAIRTLKEALELASEGGYPAEWAVYLHFLALHVLPDRKPFMKWLDSAIGRLGTYYAGDGMGDPVPSEAIDPEFDFKPEQAQELIAQYIQKVALSGNPYLTLPAMP